MIDWFKTRWRDGGWSTEGPDNQSMNGLREFVKFPLIFKCTKMDEKNNSKKLLNFFINLYENFVIQ